MTSTSDDRSAQLKLRATDAGTQTGGDARRFERGAPVQVVETGSDHDDLGAPEPGIALCLSGGGYRAMLFHLGALWRLNEIGYLPKLERISSVSGGSITAGVLGLKWERLACCGHS